MINRSPLPVPDNGALVVRLSKVKGAPGPVSVIDALCVRADAIATALEVLGPDEAYALASEREWAALLIVRGDDGEYHERPTPAFTARTGYSPHE